MKVLILAKDLYTETGGGQTSYRKIIDACPDVEFFYFEDIYSNERQVLPENVKTIKLLCEQSVEVLKPLLFPAHQYRALIEAHRFARSVKHRYFDIIEYPDYHTHGAYLREALEFNRVSYQRIIVALHGNISTSMRYRWNWDSSTPLDIAGLEKMQVMKCDAAYGLSSRYISETRDSKGLTQAVEIDAGCFVSDEFRRSEDKKTEHLPSIYCIGRSERRKGNDLFIEIMRWMDATTYRDAMQIGPSVYIDDRGIWSDDRLARMASMRDLDIPYCQLLAPKQLAAIYNSSSIIIIPSRYDSFNLVALEAIACGCVVAVSSACGVCDYLDTYYPGIPYLKLDLDRFHNSISELRKLTSDYLHVRQSLLEFLRKRPLRARTDTLSLLYSELLGLRRNTDASVSRELQYHVKSTEIVKSRLRELRKVLVSRVSSVLPQNRRWIQWLRLRPLRNFIKRLPGSTSILGFVHIYRELEKARVTDRLCRTEYATRTESTLKDINDKRLTMMSMCQGRINRVRYWLEIARLCRTHGDDLIAATYQLRAMRLLGHDRYSSVVECREILAKNGFLKESILVDSIYGQHKDTQNSITRYLSSQERAGRRHRAEAYAVRNDWRISQKSRVSVIVSLYNAETKLREFLDALNMQTLLRAEPVELILVDSNSPTSEAQLIEKIRAEYDYETLYVRTSERETIQAAWNRGIELSTGEYLVFLGVDETLYPEALEVMVNALESDSSIDWVMGDSLVTNVNDKGTLEHDVMRYRRGEPLKELTRLETCYVSWVGGMYRKSLHERFGLYDETYRAAGDTEFKSRILGKIKVKHIAQLLGEFWNYADGQTTASPKAEIEDLSAWYAYRTSEGIEYSLKDSSEEDMINQLRLTLGYRKSYCGHTSTDYEYGWHVSDILKSKGCTKAWVGQLAIKLQKLVMIMRELEDVPAPIGYIYMLKTMLRIFLLLHAIDKLARCHLGLINVERYNLFHDNRYEQHSWLW